MTRLALVLLWSALCARSAHASDLTVEWDVPPRVCPDREELRSGLSRRLQREVSFGEDARLQLSGRVIAEGSGYSLALRTRSADAVEERSLRARTCNELAQASVLIASLMFARQLQPNRRADSGAARSTPGAVDLYARAQLALDLGTLPGIGFGPSLMLGVQLGRLSLELGGFALLPRTAQSAQQSETSLQLTAAAAAGCLTLLHSHAVTLAPCLHVEAGALHAEARQVRDPRPSTQLWLSLGLGVRARVELAQWLYWYSELGGALPWDRAQFVIGELGEVHRVPILVGRLTTGLGSRF